MTHSEQLNELAAALAKAQAKIEGAKKDADNPFFRSKYADLASVWDACRVPLTSNGLSVIQFPRTEYVGTPEIVGVTSKKSGESYDVVRIACTVSVLTRLLHTSGQWIEGTVSAMLASGDPQAVGSAITYLRRYSLQSVAGVAPEDDDANAASGKTTTTARSTQSQPEPQHQTGPVTIKSVDKRDGTSKQGKPYVAYTITLSNGVKCGTLDAKLANTAIEFGKNGTPVEAVTEKNGNFLNLTELIIMQAPLTDEEREDLPF